MGNSTSRTSMTSFQRTSIGAIRSLCPYNNRKTEATETEDYYQTTVNTPWSVHIRFGKQSYFLKWNLSLLLNNSYYAMIWAYKGNKMETSFQWNWRLLLNNCYHTMICTYKVRKTEASFLMKLDIITKQLLLH